MSSLEEKKSTGWTVETLYTHMTDLFAAKEQKDEMRFNSQKETTSQALAASDKAVAKAEDAAEKRFDSVNEFRATLSDQQRTLMPRSEAELLIKSLTERISVIEKRNILESGKKQGLDIGWKIVIGLIGVGTFLISIIQVVIAISK